MDVKLIECPRDAMQGLDKIVDTDLKIEYINALLQVGFDTLDCGSFVNPKVIPQMADTSVVLNSIKMTQTKLSVIVANTRGAVEAVKFDEVTYLGYPFSVSEIFQQRNTNKSIEESLHTVSKIVNLCEQNGKKFMAYISMGFGNLYKEEWSPQLVSKWILKLKEIGAHFFSLSDTVGISKPENIKALIDHLNKEIKDFNYGCHFHTRPDNWVEKLDAAIEVGCRRFDGALLGFGGCPMADDHLVGNMPTEKMIQYFESKGLKTGLDKEALAEAMLLSARVFA